MNRIVYRDTAVGSKENAKRDGEYMAGTKPDEVFDDIHPVNFVSLEGAGIDLNDKTTVFYESTDVSGFISSTVSDGNGLSDASIAVSFLDENGATFYCLSDEITIRFFKNYCRRVEITYYHDEDIVARAEYECAELEHSFPSPTGEVIEYSKVEIKFLETENPYQLVKVAEIYFGKFISFDMLYSLNLMEQINLTGEDLAMNSLDVSLESEESLFLQQDQMFRAYNNDTSLGEFYIDSSTQDTDTRYTVTLDDPVSVLDRTYFLGGVYNSVFPQTIVNEIAKLCDVKIEMDSAYSYSDYRLSGWIPYDTCRKALLLIAFAIGAVVHVDRFGVIRLKLFDRDQYVKKISSDRILGTAKYERSKPVTGVELLEYDYRISEDENFETVFKTEASDATIQNDVVLYHDKPMSVFERWVNGVRIESITGVNPNRTIVSAPIRPDTEIKRRPFKECKTILNKDRAASGSANVKRIDRFTLRCPHFSKIEQLYDLIVQSDGEVTATIVLDGEQVGDIVDIQTRYSGVKRGVIVSLDSRINNRLVAKAVIKCLGQL